MCESSLPDGKITVRLFGYDAQIALDEGDITEETLTVTFPNTAVLYLRTYKKTPDKMKYVIATSGGTVQYDVPIMKVQAYSLDDIFEKRLLMLIPFYIFHMRKIFRSMIVTGRNWRDQRRSIRKFWIGWTDWNSRE